MTEAYEYWSSKGAGRKIAIKFDKPLLGDVTGLTPTPFDEKLVTPLGTVTASSHYSTYVPANLIDKSTSTYWYVQATGTQWCQIRLSRPTMTSGFRWYVGSSYRPSEFIVEGSNNELQWTQIYSGASENSTGWKEFNWDWSEPYLFYRWTITSRHSTYIYLYEIELSVAVGNEQAFTIAGLQKDPLFYGKPVPTEYVVDAVERYPQATLWEDDFSGDMEDVELGANGIILEEGTQSGTYITILPTTGLVTPRLCFDADVPDDTSITVEYACTTFEDPPAEWQETENGELLTIEKNYLQLRFTLETEDELISPTLLAVWLEEKEAPLDTILLHFDTYNRFNDVEGQITVEYNQLLGNLTGTRTVESFEEEFTPDDLEPTPAHEHWVTVRGAELLVDFWEAIREEVLHEHTVTVRGADLLVDFILGEVIIP